MILYLVCLKTNRIKTTICLFYRELWAILFVSSCHELQKVGAPCQMSINMLITEFKICWQIWLLLDRSKLVNPSVCVC